MNIAVLGAGAAGRDIAHACAVAGHQINLHADDATVVMDSVDIIERRFADTLDDETKEGISNLEATTGLEAAVSDVDIVIETELDQPEQLQERFAELEALVDRETIIAISASDASVTVAAAGLRHPDRALGLQFFRPPTMPLVELIVAEQTTQETVDRARKFVDSLDAISVLVRDSPGVASTRLSVVLEAEAMRMVADDIAGVEAIDTILKQGDGCSMGPLERADRVGLDERLETLDSLAETLGPRFQPPSLLRTLVEENKTGADAGEGFYVWEGGEPTGSGISTPDIPRRNRSSDDPSHR